MAENEIIKHAKAAYTAARNPAINWKHKTVEVLTEILIIVFAITLSLWLHNWSDSVKEHKEEKEYLRGLKEDIQFNMESASSNVEFYKTTLKRIAYMDRVAKGEPVQVDSLKIYQTVFFSYTNLDPRLSNYEALKASGKFNLIRNKVLLNNIIDLYESRFKPVESLNNYYFQNMNRMSYFVQEHGRLSDTSNLIANAQELLRLPEMRLLLRFGTSLINSNILRSHQECIAACKRTIAQIDKELK